MQRSKIYIPDLGVYGEIISPGYSVSLVAYTDLMVRYEVYMDNNEFIEVGEEDGM